MRSLASSALVLYPSAILAHLRIELRRHALLHVASLVAFLIACIIVWMTELRFRFEIVMTFAGFMAVMAGAFLATPLVLLKGLRLVRGDDRSPFVPDFLYRNILAPDRVARLLHVTAAMLVLQIAFSVIKRAIPVFHPFAFDRGLAELDRWLHFGFDPYQLLLPVLGAPLSVFAFSYAYNAWFFVMSVFWVWQATVDRDGGIRFILAFMLLWVVGSGGLGTIFSSVGPCYYAHLFPGDTLFEPLMNHLRAVDAVYPVAALDIQRMLWTGYVSEAGMVHGISAMPSMHVGTAALFVFAAPRGSMLRKLLAAYAVIIMVGSVLLGWHYAVDGYVGVALAVVAWKAAGALVDWDAARRASRPSAATVPAPI